MSSSTPQQLAGTETPNTIEALWDRYRGAAKALLYIFALGLAAYYGWQYYQQRELAKRWAAFAAMVQLDEVHAPESTRVGDLTMRYTAALRSVPLAELETMLGQADGAEKPYVLWVIANRAFEAGDWERARSALASLQSGFPQHPLCQETGYPVQARDPVPEDEDEDEEQPSQPDKPELEPAVSGSMAGRLAQEIERAASFTLPEHYTMPSIPADAPRYRVQLSEGWGSFTIALMTESAPEHCALFERLAAPTEEREHSFWKGMRIDTIQRVPNNPYAMLRGGGQQLHFGFESSRESDRTKWDTSKPSPEEHVVEETTGLSHFPGAVAARATAEGKSEVDRLWVCGDDLPEQDGMRQVFAYVVEGLDTVHQVCEATFARAQDEDIGQGRPSENIAIESVTKLEP